MFVHELLNLNQIAVKATAIFMFKQYGGFNPSMTYSSPIPADATPETNRKLSLVVARLN